MSEKFQTTLSGESINNIPETREQYSQTQDMTDQIASLRGRTIEQQRAALGELIVDRNIAELSDEEVKSLISDAAIDVGLKNKTTTSHAVGKEGGVSFADMKAKLTGENTEVLPHGPVRTLENGAMTNIAVAASEVRTTEAETETKTIRAQELPADAELHDIVDLENDAPTLGLRARIMDKMGLVKGAGFGANVVLGMGQLAGRRAEKQAKLEQKIADMTPEQKKKYLRRNRAITTLSTIAIGVGFGLLRSRGYWDGDLSAQGTGSGAGDINTALASEKRGLGGGNTEPGAGVTLMSERENLSYNNSDSSFYDFANKEHRGDFGSPLLADADHAKDTVNGNYNPGFHDWMNRSAHEPNGLGNLRVGLGLEGNDTSFARRNEIADLYDTNGTIHQSADKDTLAALSDSGRFSIETVSIDQPYTSTYMTDANGDPVIGMQHGVDYGGSAFKITNAETGEVTFWRTNCGGYQQIWLEDAPAPAGGETTTAQGGAVNFQETTTPIGGSPGETTPGKETPGGETPGEGGEVPEEEVPEEEVPNEEKIYDGHPEMPEGFELLKHIEDTMDPADRGNGTKLPNLDPAVAPRGEENGYNAPGTQQNTAPQVMTPEAGSGVSRTEQDAAAQQQAQQAAAQQQAANNAAKQQEAAMNTPEAVDTAVKDIQSQIGPDGRPIK